MHSLHLKLDAEDDSEEASGADHLEKEGVILGEDGVLSVWEEDFDFDDVIADGAGFEGVFAVEVHAECAAEGGEHRSADDGGPVA